MRRGKAIIWRSSLWVPCLLARLTVLVPWPRSYLTLLKLVTRSIPTVLTSFEMRSAGRAFALLCYHSPGSSRQLVSGTCEVASHHDVVTKLLRTFFRTGSLAPLLGLQMENSASHRLQRTDPEKTWLLRVNPALPAMVSCLIGGSPSSACQLQDEGTTRPSSPSHFFRTKLKSTFSEPES
jgi:sulfur relay (sulfurtransferase) DsrC/TusE family protein